MSDRLLTGKVPWDVVAGHVRGPLPPEVVPARRTARTPRWCGSATSCGPWPPTRDVRGARRRRLAVIVNANDVAVRGSRAAPFPGRGAAGRERRHGRPLMALLDEIRTTCAELGVGLIGGHTEVAPGIDHSIVCGTMLGPISDRPITTAGCGG